MKIDLTKPEVYTVKREAYTPPYNKSEVNLQLTEEFKIYLPHGAAYATKHGYEVVAIMRQAIDARLAGKKVLSLREADAAARGQVPISSPLIVAALLGPEMLGTIVEGIPGVENNVFVLRNQYNMGVQFYKTGKYKTAPEAQQKAADKRMRFLRAQLADSCLPLWDEEIEHGFPTELCKPEYMTWHQYQEASSKKVFLFDPAGSPEFEEEIEQFEEEIEHVDAKS